MSGAEGFVPPPPLTDEQVQELTERAAAAGLVVGTDWDLQTQVDVIRENQARYAHVNLMQKTRYHAAALAAEVEPYGDPARLGAALMRAAAFIGGMTLQGAGPDDAVNLLAFAGFQLYEGRTP